MSYAGPDWREQLDASRARYERPQVKSEQSDQDEWRHFGGRATVRPDEHSWLDAEVVLGLAATQLAEGDDKESVGHTVAVAGRRAHAGLLLVGLLIMAAAVFVLFARGPQDGPQWFGAISMFGLSALYWWALGWIGRVVAAILTWRPGKGV